MFSAKIAEIAEIAKIAETDLSLKTNPSAIEQFHWSNASIELKRVAPSLFALLNTCIPEKSTVDREIGVVVCAGILLRYCSERNNVIQRLFSVLMFASHSPKQVSNTQLL